MGSCSRLPVLWGVCRASRLVAAVPVSERRGRAPRLCCESSKARSSQGAVEQGPSARRGRAPRLCTKGAVVHRGALRARFMTMSEPLSDIYHGTKAIATGMNAIWICLRYWTQCSRIFFMSGKRYCDMGAILRVKDTGGWQQVLPSVAHTCGLLNARCVNFKHSAEVHSLRQANTVTCRFCGYVDAAVSRLGPGSVGVAPSVRKCLTDLTQLDAWIWQRGAYPKVSIFTL